MINEQTKQPGVRVTTRPQRGPILAIVGLLLMALVTIARESGADFAQDYAAAWAWWHGMNPSAATADIFAACCPQDFLTGAIQTAHPPFATLLVLPFGLLSFTAARAIWLILSCGLVVAAWEIGGVRTAMRWATAPLWIFGLSLGVLEPALFVLLAVALQSEQRHPYRAAILVGLAAAIKLYPAALLLGFLLRGNWRATLIGGASVVAATLLGDLIVGQGALIAWLSYIPFNTMRYVDQAGNGSLVRLIRMLLPGIAPFLAAATIFGLLAAPLIPRFRKGLSVAGLLPAMILMSPLLGAHYAACVAPAGRSRAPAVLLGISGLTYLLMRLGLPLTPLTEVVAIAPMLLGLLWIWLDLYRSTE